MTVVEWYVKGVRKISTFVIAKKFKIAIIFLKLFQYTYFIDESPIKIVTLLSLNTITFIQFILFIFSIAQKSCFETTTRCDVAQYFMKNVLQFLF